MWTLLLPCNTQEQTQRMEGEEEGWRLKKSQQMEQGRGRLQTQLVGEGYHVSSLVRGGDGGGVGYKSNREHMR